MQTRVNCCLVEARKRIFKKIIPARALQSQVNSTLNQTLILKSCPKASIIKHIARIQAKLDRIVACSSVDYLVGMKQSLLELHLVGDTYDRFAIPSKSSLLHYAALRLSCTMAAATSFMHTCSLADCELRS